MGILEPVIPECLVGNQRPHRAGLETLAAENAIRILENSVVVGDYFKILAGISKFNGIVDLDFAAGFYTAAAKDTP
jgi:hypothetical protein